jgi:hypothetical protein
MLLKQEIKKSLNIGVFDPILINQASPYCGDEIFAKGLNANGYEVIRFDYRATNNPCDDLLELAKRQKTDPTIIWIGKAERITPETIFELRQLFPDAIFVKWAADVRDMPTPHDIGHLQYVDWFFGTFAGNYLRAHLLPNMKGVGSILTFTDSSFYKGIEVEEKWKSDILWTGRRGFGDNPIRNEVIEHLQSKKSEYEKTDEVRTKISMFMERNWLGNPEYLYAINGARIGIGVNSFNRRKYSSDRLGNYVACGTFYLMHYVEGIEECFEKGVDLDWFESIEELDEKTDFYLKNDSLRNVIARNGRKKVLDNFDFKPLVFNLLNVIKNKRSDYAWDEVYLND